MFDIHIEENSLSLSKLPNFNQIKDEISLFSQYDRVIFCTMGKSAFACRKLVYTARSYGLEWHDLDVCHAFHGDAGIIKPNDLLVFVSKSGETKETVAVANYFDNWESIAITSNKDSILNKICKNEIVIPVKTECSPFGFAPMISTSMYMIVLHGILCETVIGKGLTIEEYAKNHPAGKIGKDLKDAIS